MNILCVGKDPNSTHYNNDLTFSDP